MPLTISDLEPIGLCLVTQDLLDTKRFMEYFGDNVILRMKDKSLSDFILPLKREINSNINQKKFFEGYKIVIINNIDKILSHLGKFASLDVRAVENMVKEGKDIIKKVIFAGSFEELKKLEPIFKSKITLPLYSLFLKYEKTRG